MTGSSPAPVILASPVSHPPSARHSSSSAGPAARWMAPSTPPPPRRPELAAVTSASARSSAVMSPRCSVMLSGIGTRLPLALPSGGERELELAGIDRDAGPGSVRGVHRLEHLRRLEHVLLGGELLQHDSGALTGVEEDLEPAGRDPGRRAAGLLHALLQSLHPLGAHA